MSYLKGLYYNIKPIIDVLDHALALSTPHVHKFKTEMCKNFELTGKCQFGEKVSNYSESTCSHLTDLCYISVFICSRKTITDGQKWRKRIIQNEALQKISAKWILSLRTEMSVHSWWFRIINWEKYHKIEKTSYSYWIEYCEKWVQCIIQLDIVTNLLRRKASQNPSWQWEEQFLRHFGP